MKKFILIVIALCMILSLIACNANTPIETGEWITVGGDRAWLPSTFEELSSPEYAKDIIRIEIIDVWEEEDGIPWAPEWRDTMIKHKVRVLEVFKGELRPGEIIEVWSVVHISMQHDIRIELSFEIGDDIIVFQNVYTAESGFKMFFVSNNLSQIYRIPLQENIRNTDGTRTSAIHSRQLEIVNRGPRLITVSGEELASVAQRNGLEVGRDIPNFSATDKVLE